MLVLRQRLAELTGWRRAGLAFLLGVVATGALPPYFLPPLLIVAFGGLIWLLDKCRPRRAALTGWWFGFGHMVSGLYWIAHAFFVDAERFAMLTPLPVLGLPAFLALYPAAATALTAWLTRPGWTRVAVFAAAWTLAEWLRGLLFTGFPWNFIGYSWAGTGGLAVLQFSALGGILGLSLVTVLVAALPALLASDDRRFRIAVPMAGFLLLAAIAGAGFIRLAQTPPDIDGVWLRVVQPNIAQADKWQRTLRQRNLDLHLELVGQDSRKPITHVIWPETAVPYFLANDPARRAEIASALPPGATLLAGTIRLTAAADEPRRAWNSLVAIRGDGSTVATYDKRHLVPFGEYLPLRNLVAGLGLEKLASAVIAGDFESGRGPLWLTLPGAPPVRPLICYEGVFRDEISGSTPPRPAWLLNATNDSWFGTSAGPHQHLAIARTRAVEQGLPLVRAANTGISTIVDAHGRIRDKLGLGRRGILDGALPGALPEPTLYNQYGDWPVGALIVVILFVAVWQRRSQSR